jgi:hypothetical protein
VPRESPGGQISYELIKMRLGQLLHRHIAMTGTQRPQRVHIGGAGRRLNVVHPSEPIPACLLDSQN